VVTPLVIRERTPVHLPRLKGSLIESSTGSGLISRMPCACGKSRWAFVHFRPSACRKASAVRPSFCSNQQIDFVGAKPAFFRELLEGLELVGGMHVFSGDAVVQADLAWVVCSIDDAPDRLGLLVSFRFIRKGWGELPALADGHEIIALPPRTAATTPAS